MQTGIHYTKDNQKVKVVSVDEENKIAYIDYLNGQKKWVNEKEYKDMRPYSREIVIEEQYYSDESIVSSFSTQSEGIVPIEEDFNPKTKKVNKKKDDTANKK